MKKKLLLTCAGLAFLWQAEAQIVPYTRTLNAAGGTKTAGGNTYEWSVGEMALVNTWSKPNIIVTQGVLQPAPNDVGIRNIKPLTDAMRVYPNPAQTLVHLNYNLKQGVLTYELQDITGKTIRSKKQDITSGEQTEEIQLGAVANGTYMLNVVYSPEDGAPQTTSFKIDKIEQ